MMNYRSVVLLTLFILPASIIASRADDSRHDTLSNTESNGEVRRWEVTGPWGGDVRALVAAPDNENLLYLGTTDGQIFRSTDGAKTWGRLKPGLDKRGLSVDNIVIDPQNGKVIYAAAWNVAQGSGGKMASSRAKTAARVGRCSMQPRDSLCCRWALLRLIRG